MTQNFTHFQGNLTKPSTIQRSNLFKMSATRDFMWDLRYKQLVDYKELHGNCEVPQKLGQLGRWVHRQRESKNKGFLSDDRVAKLDELGFVWRQKSCRPTDTWDERYLQLIKYKEIHGNCNVVRTYKQVLCLLQSQALHSSHTLTFIHFQFL